MADYQATPEQWNTVQRCADVVGSADCSAVLELRARVETLEAAAQKHIVETSANILALASRFETLEAAKRPTSKVYEINKPLQLTPEQAQQITDLLTPNSSASLTSSLVLLRHWIKDRGCAKSSAYKWLGILGIRPRREVNRATGKVESWLTDEQAATLTAYADALFAGHKSNDARDMATTRRSLVERVASAITDDDALSELWHDDARAAIREVAAWMTSNPDHHFPPALVFALEQEAEI